MMLMSSAWRPSYAALVFAMWAIMMVGMMLPSAAPAILKAVSLAQKRPLRFARGKSFKYLDRVQDLPRRRSGSELEGLEKGGCVTAQLRVVIRQETQVVKILGTGQFLGLLDTLSELLPGNHPFYRLERVRYRCF
jgi:hypothetical protein